MGRKIYPSEEPLPTNTTNLKLKIIMINDVYELGRLPKYSTCRKKEDRGDEGCLTIGILAGDFIAPSLLSCIDNGVGMIDCLNKCKMDYVCFGNHEADIPFTQLHARIRESKFQWVNSNMQSMRLPSDIRLPEYCIIEIKTVDCTRKVALLGFNTEDPSIRKKTAFGGCSVEPIYQTAQALFHKIMEHDPSVDLVIPMTHQLMPLDRELAKCNLFPIILGGHEHVPFNEEVSGCTIVKTGMDAKNIAIIEICWPQSGDVKPTISVNMTPSSEYEDDPEVVDAVKKHQQILSELNDSELCRIPKGIQLSSQAIRVRPNSLATFLCTAIRLALDVEVVLLASGSVRGNKSYIDAKAITYADLVAEIVFDTFIIEIELPGSVIDEMVRYTRGFALQRPPQETGGYLQTDDSVTWDSVANRVTHIAGTPLDPARVYRVAVTYAMLTGMDNIIPLMSYKASLPATDRLRVVDDEAGVEAKQLLVRYFARNMLVSLFSGLDLEDLDATKGEDGDGSNLRISKLQLQELAVAKFGDEVKSSLVINNLFAIADADQSGFIDKRELLELSLASFTGLQMSATGTSIGNPKDPMSLDEIVEKLRIQFKSTFDEDLIRSELKMIDKSGDGYITVEEYKAYIQSKLSLHTTNLIV